MFTLSAIEPRASQNVPSEVFAAKGLERAKHQAHTGEWGVRVDRYRNEEQPSRAVEIWAGKSAIHGISQVSIELRAKYIRV